MILLCTAKSNVQVSPSIFSGGNQIKFINTNNIAFRIVFNQRILKIECMFCLRRDYTKKNYIKQISFYCIVWESIYINQFVSIRQSFL